MSDEANTRQSAKRTRSPAYPAIGLQEAIQKTKVLWDKAKRHPASIYDLSVWWNFEKGSSAAMSAVSALSKFGLTENEGSGAERTARITESGIKLVFNPDPDSTEYRHELRKAALLPGIHSEIWDKFFPELPDDSVIERYLVIQREFNPQYVKGFIKQFRETIDFAGLTGDNAATDEPAPSEMPAPQATLPPQSTGFPVALPAAAPVSPVQIVTPKSPGREFVLPTPAGDIVIRGPFPMKKKDWETFKQVIALFEPWLVKPDDADTTD